MFGQWGQTGRSVTEGTELVSVARPKAFRSFPHRPSLHELPLLGQRGLPTFPWATSSLCAAEADLTRALVAAAMDLAASKICSSKSRVSSACYNQKKTVSHEIHTHKGHLLPSYVLLGHLALHLSLLFVGKPYPGRKAETASSCPLSKRRKPPALTFCTNVNSGSSKADSFSRPEALKRHKSTVNQISRMVLSASITQIKITNNQNPKCGWWHLLPWLRAQKWPSAMKNLIFLGQKQKQNNICIFVAEHEESYIRTKDHPVMEKKPAKVELVQSTGS